MEKAVNKSLEFRKERKFVVTALNIDQLESIVKSHPALFSRAYPPRFVNNIYFDSPKYQNYGANVVGSANRTKIRIRWYGDQFGYIAKPILEMKIKKGLAGTKKHVALQPFNLKEGLSHKTIRKLIDQSDVTAEIREMLEYLSPTLLNRYFRKYYISSDRKYRITLDHKLSYTRIARYQNYFLQRVQDNSRVILELKYGIEDDEDANRISREFPFRMTKNSKYVNGVDRLDLW